MTASPWFRQLASLDEAVLSAREWRGLPLARRAIAVVLLAEPNSQPQTESR